MVCSLRRRLFGADNIFPVVDWEKCTLSCGGVETVAFDLDVKMKEVDILALDDIDHKMQYLRQKQLIAVDDD